jgi:DNA polymerase delta subunit 1
MVTGSPAEIAHVAVYCVQDCHLLVKLSVRLQIFAGNVEMSRVCCTPMELLVTRGQQVKVVNQLIWYGHRMQRDADGQNGYIMNTPATFSGCADDTYMGATVIDAKASYYTDPIATLDFLSLYPSIIMANNFCFSTLVQSRAHEALPGIRYATIEMDGKRYVWAKNHEGVIPQMVKALLAARKQAKRHMGDAFAAMQEAKARLDADAADEDAREALAQATIRHAVFNARQSALKVSANSIYGFTGAVKAGQYPCLAVADSVTVRAREMLHKTVTLVKSFTPCDVVYGDTDSVMVKFDGVTTVEEAAVKAAAAADWITQQFQEMTGTEYIVLEFEKVYFPYLLMRKKRYAGLMFEPDKGGVMQMTKLDAKGIELVRRDSCPHAKKMQKLVLDALMYKRDPLLAQRHIAEQLARVVADEVPVTEYKISKSLRKDYKSQDLPHLAVRAKMYQRQPGSEPQIGDRVPYVLLYDKTNPKAKTFEKAEDIGFVLRNPNTCKIDRLYYVERYIQNPICSLLELVVDKPSALFDDARRRLSHQQSGQRSILTMLQGDGAGDGDGGGTSFEDAMFATTATRHAPPAKPKRPPQKRPRR